MQFLMMSDHNFYDCCSIIVNGQYIRQDVPFPNEYMIDLNLDTVDNQGLDLIIELKNKDNVRNPILRLILWVIGFIVYFVLESLSNEKIKTYYHATVFNIRLVIRGDFKDLEKIKVYSYIDKDLIFFKTDNKQIILRQYLNEDKKSIKKNYLFWVTKTCMFLGLGVLPLCIALVVFIMKGYWIITTIVLIVLCIVMRNAKKILRESYMEYQTIKGNIGSEYKEIYGKLQRVK